MFRPPCDTHYATLPDQTTDRSGSKAPGSLPRPNPSVEQVIGIVEWAAICQKRNAEEVAWNSAVHYPILRLALHGDGGALSWTSLNSKFPRSMSRIHSDQTDLLAHRRGTHHFRNHDQRVPFNWHFGERGGHVLHIAPTNDSGHGDDAAAARIDSCRALLRSSPSTTPTRNLSSGSSL